MLRVHDHSRTFRASWSLFIRARATHLELTPIILGVIKEKICISVH